MDDNQVNTIVSWATLHTGHLTGYNIHNFAQQLKIVKIVCPLGSKNTHRWISKNGYGLCSWTAYVMSCRRWIFFKQYCKEGRIMAVPLVPLQNKTLIAGMVEQGVKGTAQIRDGKVKYGSHVDGILGWRININVSSYIVFYHWQRPWQQFRGY